MTKGCSGTTEATSASARSTSAIRSANGMAAMTNGDKGEEVCNALRQRVAGLWLALRRFVGVSLLLIAITDDIEQRRLSPSAGRSQIDMASWAQSPDGRPRLDWSSVMPANTAPQDAPCRSAVESPIRYFAWRVSGPVRDGKTSQRWLSR
jgi:hypothetical protein